MLASSSLIAMVATADAGRARVFYEDVLGLNLIADDVFALVFETGETSLRVTKVENFTPQPFSVLAWQVPDIRDGVTALSAKGIAFERYEGMDQDDQGIWNAPGGASIAWFKDPDGNMLSLVEAPRANSG